MDKQKEEGPSSKWSSIGKRIYNWGHSLSFVPRVIGGGTFPSELFNYYQRKLISEGIILTPPTGRRSADLLVIVGKINYKMLPQVLQAYQELKGERFVICIQAMASKKDKELEYNTIHDISTYIPVDAYINGVPPTYESVKTVLENLRQKR